MNPAEIIVQEVQGQVVFVVCPLLAMRIGKSGHAAYCHADTEVLALNMGGANKVRKGIAAN